MALRQSWSPVVPWAADVIPKTPMGEHRYFAFISYSHADERWSRWLHRALETYRVPKRLVGRATAHGPIPARLTPVFRDRDELAGAADLGSKVTAALEASRYLIVICSRAAAQSRWVNEEVRVFKRMGRADLIGNGKRDLVPRYQPAGTGGAPVGARSAPRAKPCCTP